MWRLVSRLISYTYEMLCRITRRLLSWTSPRLKGPPTPPPERKSPLLLPDIQTSSKEITLLIKTPSPSPPPKRLPSVQAEVVIDMESLVEVVKEQKSSDKLELGKKSESRSPETKEEQLNSFTAKKPRMELKAETMVAVVDAQEKLKKELKKKQKRKKKKKEEDPAKEADRKEDFRPNYFIAIQVSSNSVSFYEKAVEKVFYKRCCFEPR
jgi:hypothetical protein